jgi:hypothetical protein
MFPKQSRSQTEDGEGCRQPVAIGAWPPTLHTLRDLWLAAREDACAAYRWWHHAPRSFQGDAYAVYLAAADREEAAARAYAEAVRR